MKHTLSVSLSLALVSSVLQACSAAPFVSDAPVTKHLLARDDSPARCSDKPECATTTQLDIFTNLPYVRFIRASTDGIGNNQQVLDLKNCLTGGKLGGTDGVALQWRNGAGIDPHSAAACQSWILSEIAPFTTQTFPVQVADSQTHWGWDNGSGGTPGLAKLDPLWTLSQAYVFDCLQGWQESGLGEFPYLGTGCLMKMATGSPTWQCLSIKPGTDANANHGDLEAVGCDGTKDEQLFNIRSVVSEFAQNHQISYSTT